MPSSIRHKLGTRRRPRRWRLPVRPPVIGGMVSTGHVSATSIASISRGGCSGGCSEAAVGPSFIGRPLAAGARGTARPSTSGACMASARARPRAPISRRLSGDSRSRRASGGHPPAGVAVDDHARLAPFTASGALLDRPAITGRPVSAASAKTMPKPSTSKPPQRVRHGEAKRSAARSQSVTATSTRAPVRCTRPATPRR